MRVLLFILSLGIVFHLKAQKPPINVLFVMDGSSSMTKKWGKEDKWTIAEKSLLQIADSLLKEHENLQFGLRVYGHQSLPMQNDCKDTELKLPITKNTLTQLKNSLHSVNPKGITPLAFTLEQTKIDFAGLEGQKNILVLITDGSESCLGDPCKILEILLAQEVIVKPVIIGLDIDIESLRDYHCISDVFNPHTVEEFQRNVLQVVHQAINYTTLQVRLLDENSQALQSNIPMLFFSQLADPAYTFYHKLNKQGQPDTLLIDPLPKYTLIVQTIPPIVKTGIKLSGNKHNVITLDAPTTELSVNAYFQDKNIDLIPDIPYFIKRSEEEGYIYGHEMNTSQSYLQGIYDIDVLTLPITSFRNVALNSQTKELKIDAPGRLVVNAKFPIHAALFTEINNKLVNIYTFPAHSKQEILDLQPGNYSLVYRFDHKREMTETVIENFQIKTKETVELKF